MTEKLQESNGHECSETDRNGENSMAAILIPVASRSVGNASGTPGNEPLDSREVDSTTREGNGDGGSPNESKSTNSRPLQADNGGAPARTISVGTGHGASHDTAQDESEERDDDEIIDIVHDASQATPELRLSANSDRNRLKSRMEKKTGDPQPRQLMEFMRIGGRDKGLVGIKKIRASKKFCDLEKTHRGHVVRIVRNLFVKTTKMFCPYDHHQLLNAVMSEVACNTAVAERLRKCLSVCPARSIEKRLVRSIIYGVIGGRMAKNIIAEDASYTYQAVDGEDSDDGEDDALIEGEAGGQNDGEGHDAADGDIALEGGDEPRYRLGGCRRTMRRAEEDWHHFVSTGFIPEVKRRNKKIIDESVKESVYFVFRKENRQVLAHGTKIYRTQDGDVVDIPKIRRTKSRMAIWRDYNEYKKTHTNIPKVSRSVLARMMTALTSGQQKLKACVDYCLGVLVFENVRLLQYIIKKRVLDIRQQTVLSDQLTAVENFLKHGFYAHVNSDSDNAHDARRALCGTTSVESVEVDSNPDYRSNCMECLKPFQVVENIRAYVRQETDGVKDVLDDASNKFQLFMRHQLRCHVQHIVFADATRMLLESAPEKVAIVVMHYKMKFEPRKFRQKSSDWYGRKGMSWHGSVVTYRMHPDPVAGTASTESDNVKMKNVYLDHICKNDSNQTAFAVCQILELVCRQISLLVPHMDEVIIQTDNAANYSNRIFPVAAPFICRKYGLRLTKILHNETQDGKGAADVHFAVASKHVDRYMEEGKLDVMTPDDLYKALNHGEGLKGCIAELFEVDMEHDEAKKWSEAFQSKDESTGLGELGRLNEIRYTYGEDSCNVIHADTFVYKYSVPVRWVMKRYRSSRQGGAPVVEAQPQPEKDESDDDETGESADYDTASSVQRPLFIGPMTGVRLVKSAFVKRASVHVKSKKTEVTTSGCDRAAGETDCEASGLDEGPRRLTLEEERNLMFKKVGECYLCSKCGNSYQHMEDVMHHHQNCRQPTVSETYTDRAARLLQFSIQTGEIEVHTSPTENRDLQCLTVSNHVKETVQFPPFWAIRPGSGDSLGMNFVGQYKTQIQEMVEQGNVDKGKKLSAGQMQEQLQLLNPNRYDIPSTHHIQQYVKVVLNAAKAAAVAQSEVVEGTPARVRKEKYKMPVLYSQNLEVIVQRNMNIKPTQAETALLAALNITAVQKAADFPTSERIKNKVSSLKTKIRKQRGR